MKAFNIYQNHVFLCTQVAKSKEEALEKTKKEFKNASPLYVRPYKPNLWDYVDKIIKLGLRKNWIADRLNMSPPTLTKKLSGYLSFTKKEETELCNILGLTKKTEL